MSDATCIFAFHKKGVWTEEGHVSLRSGAKHQGSGLWADGTDSSTIRYACFAGNEPVDAQGRSCTGQIRFAGMTDAGSDK